MPNFVLYSKQMKSTLILLILALSFISPIVSVAQEPVFETGSVYPGCEQLESEEEKRECFQIKINNFIYEKIRYPQEAVESEIQGKVYVQFIINANGDVTKIEVVRGVHKTLDTEAVRVISQLPKFIPATYNGQATNTYFRIPVNFELR